MMLFFHHFFPLEQDVFAIVCAYEALSVVSYYRSKILTAINYAKIGLHLCSHLHHLHELITYRFYLIMSFYRRLNGEIEESNRLMEECKTAFLEKGILEESKKSKEEEKEGKEVDPDELEDPDLLFVEDELNRRKKEFGEQESTEDNIGEEIKEEEGEKKQEEEANAGASSGGDKKDKPKDKNSKDYENKLWSITGLISKDGSIYESERKRTKGMYFLALAFIAGEDGDWQHSIDYALEAKAACQGQSLAHFRSLSLIILLWNYFCIGEIPSCLDMIDEVEALSDEEGNRLYQRLANQVKCVLYYYQGKWEELDELLSFIPTGFTLNPVYSCIIAALALKKGNLEESFIHIEFASHKMANRTQNGFFNGIFLLLLGTACLKHMENITFMPSCEKSTSDREVEDIEAMFFDTIKAIDSVSKSAPFIDILRKALVLRYFEVNRRKSYWIAAYTDAFASTCTMIPGFDRSDSKDDEMRIANEEDDDRDLTQTEECIWRFPFGFGILHYTVASSFYAGQFSMGKYRKGHRLALLNRARPSIRIEKEYEEEEKEKEEEKKEEEQEKKEEQGQLLKGRRPSAFTPHPIEEHIYYAFDWAQNYKNKAVIISLEAIEDALEYMADLKDANLRL
jgi:hypothetical protein